MELKVRIFVCCRKLYKISETIDDMIAYSKLNDSLYYRIYFSTEPELEPARNIIERIEKRQLYKCVGQTKPERGVTISTVSTGLI